MVFGLASIVGATVGALAAVAVPDWIKLAAFCLLLVVAGTLLLHNAGANPRAAVLSQARSPTGHQLRSRRCRWSSCWPPAPNW